MKVGPAGPAIILAVMLVLHHFSDGQRQLANEVLFRDALRDFNALKGARIDPRSVQSRLIAGDVADGVEPDFQFEAARDGSSPVEVVDLLPIDSRLHFLFSLCATNERHLTYILDSCTHKKWGRQRATP